MKYYTILYGTQNSMVPQYRKIMAMTFMVIVQVMVELYAYLMCAPPIGFGQCLCVICEDHMDIVCSIVKTT